MQPRTQYLQFAMVIMVLGATIFLAIKHDELDIVFNLCSLTFGYYFGSDQSNPPPDALA